MRFILSVVSAVALVGCVTYQPYEIQTPFAHEDFAWAQSPGSGVIEGQAFMRQQGGGVVTAAGSEVLALPANDYTAEIARAMQLGLAADGWANMRPAVANYTRSTIAGVDGDFRFDGLPAGNWIIATEVIWVVANRYQGGALAQRVSLGEGETEKVILSR